MPDVRPSARSLVRFGPFEADLRSGELRRNGVRVSLQDQPFRILVQLVGRPGEVVTREELRKELWPDNTFVDFEHGLNAAIRRLRDALDDSADSPRYVETLPRRGYRFIGSVNNGGERPAPTVPDSKSEDGRHGGSWQLDRRALWAGAGAGLALGAALTMVVGWAVGRRGTPEDGGAPSQIAIQANRVAVTAFENGTADPSLDSLGRLVADRIVQTASEVSAVEVIPRVVEAGAEHPGVVAGDAAALGRVSGASLVVTGVFYLSHDRLEFHARILDTASGELLHAAEPVIAAQNAPAEAFRQLGQTVAGALAIHFDDFFGGLNVISHPPTLDAYLEYRAGLTVFDNDYPRGLKHLQRALEIDPRFWMPRLMMFFAYGNRGETEEAGRILSRILNESERFTLAERLFVEYWRKDREGQTAQALRLLEVLEPLVPGSRGVNLNLMTSAVMLNRPKVAVEAYDRLPPSSRNLEHSTDTWRLAILAMALHLLGDHRRELEESRLALGYAPGNMGLVVAEARALAALGRVDELTRLIDESTTIPREGDSPGGVMLEAARELRAHGHPDEALGIASRAVDWERGRKPEVMATENHRAELAEALYLAERWEEAEGLFSTLAAERPDVARYQGFIGAIAARCGDRDRAQRIRAELTRPGLDLLHEPTWTRVQAATFWRAHIALLLGDRDSAVDLLSDALARGLPFGLYFHNDPDFESLRDYPPFLELIRPRG